MATNSIQSTAIYNPLTDTAPEERDSLNQDRAAFVAMDVLEMSQMGVESLQRQREPKPLSAKIITRISDVIGDLRALDPAKKVMIATAAILYGILFYVIITDQLDGKQVRP
jgi:hypothetical protein